MLKNEYNESDNQLELAHPEDTHEGNLKVNLADTPEQSLNETPEQSPQDTPEDTPRDRLEEIIKQELSTCPKSTIINLHPNVFKLFKALQGDLHGVHTSKSTPSAVVKHLLLFWYSMTHKYDVNRAEMANTMLQTYQQYNKAIISGTLTLEDISKD